jgi:hypothetical protein
MPDLKFSHDYYKLPPNWENTKAILLEGIKVKLEQQTEQLLEYDTQIREPPNKAHGIDHYTLPDKGDYLLLIFQHETGAVFTTLRRWTKQKEEYYANAGSAVLEFTLIRTRD